MLLLCVPHHGAPSGSIPPHQQTLPQPTANYIQVLRPLRRPCLGAALVANSHFIHPSTLLGNNTLIRGGEEAVVVWGGDSRLTSSTLGSQREPKAQGPENRGPLAP